MNRAGRRRSAAQADPLTRRIARLLRKDGEHCHGCRRAFTNGQSSAAGFTASGRLMVVGDCCAEKLVLVVGFSIYLSCPPPLPPWQEDDRTWFDAHPDRSHRLRRAHPEEWPDPAGPGRSHTAVRQLKEGKRLRLALTLPDHVPPDAPEEAAWAIFDLVNEAKAKGDTEVAAPTIRELIRLLSEGGRA